MESLFQALIAILCCFFLVYMLSDIKKALLRTVNKGDTVLLLAVRAEGEGEDLPRTLKAAEILQKESRMRVEIVILDDGMDEKARKRAENFVRGNMLARIAEGGEDLWKIPNTPE